MNFSTFLFLREPTEFVSSSTEYVPRSLHMKTETDPVSETLLFSSDLEFQTMDKIQKSVIRIVMYHRQKTL
jgi:hypothetical protein